MKRVVEPGKVHNLHQYDIDLDNCEIYLIGREEYIDRDIDSEPGVEFGMASRFIKNLNLCHANGREGRKFKGIIIHMKTGGGMVDEGMAIYDAIKTCPNPTTIINYKDASSMSSLIFQAASKRIMMPHATFMFHMGSDEVSGTIKQVQSYLKFNKQDVDVMLEIYASRMKQKGKYEKWSKTKIKEWLLEQMNRSEEVYLTAKQTVDLGLADEIFTSWRCVRG